MTHAANEVSGRTVDRRTRAQAIKDGSLVDVSKTEEAAEVGFKCPVALTRDVWSKYVEGLKGTWGLGQKGLLSDILSVYSSTYKTSRRNNTVYFDLFVPNGDDKAGVSVATLKGVKGTGDEGEPVVTIMEFGARRKPQMKRKEFSRFTPEMLFIFKDVVNDLTETHDEEMKNDHYGDRGCSYCTHIQLAREILALSEKRMRMTGEIYNAWKELWPLLRKRGKSSQEATPTTK